MNGWRMYLLPIGLLILAALCGIFYFALGDMDNALLDEKVEERRIDLELICAQIDAFIELDDDWRTYDYRAIIGQTMTWLDKTENAPLTFAAAYDNKLELISKREASYFMPAEEPQDGETAEEPQDRGVYFDPLQFPEFTEIIQAENSGIIDLWFEDTAGGITGRTMKTLWQWVPTDETLGNRFLLVVSVSKHSVNHGISSWLRIAAEVALAIAGAFILGTSGLLTYLGHIFDMREGKIKWRTRMSL